MEKAKRIIVCSADVPHPSRGASMVILHYYLEALHAEGFDILHLLVLTPKANPEHVREYEARVAGRGRYRIIVSSVRDYYERRHAWQPYVPLSLPAATVAALIDFSPDILFGFDIAAMGILGKAALPGKKVAWLGDLNFQTAWYHGLYALKESLVNLPQLPIAWLKRIYAKRLYHSVLRDADKIFVALKSSERELGLPCEFLPYPWPSLSPPSLLPPRATKPTFVFLGNLSGLGSRSALHFLLDKIYPAMQRRWGKNGFSVIICGINTLPEWVGKRIATMPELPFIGFADDLASLLLSSHGGIIPIDVPVGNRTRIITCWSLGVPVVAHPNTALGNPSLKDGDTGYLAADAGLFVEKMDRLVSRSPEVEAMIHRARQSYVIEYEPEKAGRNFARILMRHS